MLNLFWCGVLDELLDEKNNEDLLKRYFASGESASMPTLFEMLVVLYYTLWINVNILILVPWGT